MAKKSKNNYIDNKKLYQAMVEYRRAVEDAKKSELPRPPVTNFIGECIMKIAVHLSYRPNFINYTYREEMISDGIENCLMYIDNFDSDNYKNPFAYFTQIIWFAFLRRLEKEKKQTYVKMKVADQQNLFNMNSTKQEHDKFANYNDGVKYNEWTEQYVGEFIDEFETKKRRKVRKYNRKPVDKLLE